MPAVTTYSVIRSLDRFIIALKVLAVAIALIKSIGTALVLLIATMKSVADGAYACTATPWTEARVSLKRCTSDACKS